MSHKVDRPVSHGPAAVIGAALLLACCGGASAQDFTAALQTQPDPAARALLLREIAAARALPPELARRRLLALAHGVGGGAVPVVVASTQTDGGVVPSPTLADPVTALAFSQAVLRRDPANLAARAQAIRAALQTGQPELGTSLAADAVDDRPNDPSGWVLAAEVAQAAGMSHMALADLDRARQLRTMELSSDMGDGSGGYITATPLPPPTALAPAGSATPLTATTPDTPAVTPAAATVPTDGAVPIPDSVAAAADPANGTADPQGSYRTAQTYYTNPFRDQATAPPAPSAVAAPSQADSAAANDPMTQQINTTIAALQAKTAPTVQAELSLTGRSGATGLSGLGDIAAPMEATFSPDGYGRLKFVVTPTLLFAGDLSGSPLQQAQFGTQALAVNQISKTEQTLSGALATTRNASGVALDADYAYSWFEGDVGSTPLGFRVENAVGGVTLSPQLSDNITLRVTGERRAVTDSLLAYGGVQDTRTGNTMGGVIRNRGYAQISISDGGGFWYVGGGGDVLRGENVASNTESEAGAGVNYPVWNSRTDEVRVGANLVYFGYAKNLDFFTLGQGGYFSPQSYEALLFPISYSHEAGRLSYEVSGSVGVQTFRESGSLFYPTNEKLEAELTARTDAVSGLRNSYGAQTTTGITGGAHGEIQYAILPNFNIGGSADFERSGNFDQSTGLIYARYTFDGVR